MFRGFKLKNEKKSSFGKFYFRSANFEEGLSLKVSSSPNPLSEPAPIFTLLNTAAPPLSSFLRVVSISRGGFIFMLSCVYTCKQFVHEHDICGISTGFANSLLQTFSVGFFDERKGCSQISGYGVLLNFCSLPCSQEDFPISPTIFTQLPVVHHWFVIFPWFVGSLWKNKFSEHVCKHNVRKCIRSFRLSQ